MLTWESFIQMQLVYLDIFEDTHNIARDRFITDSVKAVKNTPLDRKKRKEISIYINLSQSHQEAKEIFNRNNNNQNFRKPFGSVLLGIYDAIKFS